MLRQNKSFLPQYNLVPSPFHNSTQIPFSSKSKQQLIKAHMTIETHNHDHNHNHSDSPPKMQRCQDYINALEEERRKIQVFQRELPLCLELVTQAIEACKQQLSTEYNLYGQSECSEQTSSGAPVLEEFIPLKSSEEQESNQATIIHKDDNNCKKSDWLSLRSVQLCNETSDLPTNEDSPQKSAVVDVKRNRSGGAFHPFKKEENQIPTSANTIVAPVPLNRSVPPASTSSSAETGGGGGGNKKTDKEKEREAQRKARRCWSTELHRKFLQALQQLGGSHLATPKQIRELMKVDGLTNDEVKSHLQKYRLHTRRPSPSTQNSNTQVQVPQFVLVGGIWVPPGEAPGAATSNGIYAPVAMLPAPFREASAKPPQSESECGVQSHSPATSSTHTTTASPSYSP